MKVVLVATKESFAGGSWSSPESSLSAEDFCKVCLVDYNSPGETKTKAKCKLPVRSKPGGPINKAALRNASSRISQMTGVPAEVKARAAAKLARLKKQAGIGED
jgi:hypothetical protein